jgi:hypothetical protein
MLGSAYLIFTSLAGFYTLCLTKSAAVKAPKPLMKRVPLVSKAEIRSSQDSAQSASATWGQSSGLTIGIAWESNSAGIADKSGHHYTFGPSIDETSSVARLCRLESKKNLVLRFPAKRAEHSFQDHGSLPPAA